MKPSLEQATQARLDEIRDVLMSGAGELAGKSMREMGEIPDESGKIIKRFRGFSHAYPELVKYSYPRQTLLRALHTKKGKVYELLERAARDVMEYEGYVERKKASPGRPTVEPHEGKRKCMHCGVKHTKGQHRFHGTGSFHHTHLFSFGGKMSNPGRGRGFLFFGSFTSKLAARRKEARIPDSFIREKNGRYYVMKVRQTTTRRVSNPQHKKKLVRIYGRVLRVIAKKTGAHGNCDAECKRCNHEYFHDFKPGAVMYGQPDGSILIKKG